MAEAVICDVRVAAAHDGVAELVVILEHGNGGRSEVTLDAVGAAALFRACGSTRPGELVGQGWEKVREALGVSWNRLAGTNTGG